MPVCIRHKWKAAQNSPFKGNNHHLTEQKNHIALDCHQGEADYFYITISLSTAVIYAFVIYAFSFCLPSAAAAQIRIISNEAAKVCFRK